LASRILTAVVAVPLLLFVVYQEDPMWVWGLVFLAGAIAMSEFFAMTLGDRTDRLVSLAVGLVATAALYWMPSAMHPGFFALVLATLPILLYYLFRFGSVENVAARIGYSVTGIVYVGCFFAFLGLIKRDFGPHSGHIIVLVLASAWLSDTGGYFAGKALGKRKLYEAVSPNKTWAGAIGGTVAAAGGAALIKHFLLTELSWIDVFALAIPGSVLGQLGDLAESLIKRSTGVKDSGALLPGHGGLLDRVDAVLFIAPYFYLYLHAKAWITG